MIPPLPHDPPAIPALLAIMTIVAACGLPGTTDRPPETRDGPDPFDHALEAESIVPTTDTLSTRPTLYLQFNDYLEDDSFRIYNAGRLQSGALSWPGWTDYVMTDKTLIWSARSPVPPGLDVSFGLSGDLRSVTGSPLEQNAELISYRTADRDPLPNPNPLPSATWADVRPIFDDHCSDCHGADDWPDLNPLTPDSLVGEPSAQIDKLLVRPYDPTDSYLMHKLLWDFPLRRNSPQPPPWAGGQQLPRRDLITVEQWIAAGAPGPR